MSHRVSAFDGMNRHSLFAIINVYKEEKFENEYRTDVRECVPYIIWRSGEIVKYSFSALYCHNLWGKIWGTFCGKVYLASGAIFGLLRVLGPKL